MTAKKQYSSFDDMIATADGPVLVSFYATWCGYCKQMAPILEQVKHRMGDRLTVVKINSEKYPQLASKYEVTSLPTSVLFIEGEPASRIRGVMQESELMQYIQKFL